MIRLPASVHLNAGTVEPVGLRVPHFDTLNPPSVARKVDCTRHSSRRNAIPDLEIGIGTILEMHNNAIEIDG